MAGSGSLNDAFIDELRDAYNAENQLLKALPKMAKKATDGALSAAFLAHREETTGHIEKLEAVFGLLGQKVRGKHCDGIAGILEEGRSVMEESFDGQTMDACLIASGQRAEHYEMAAYGTLVAWARVLGQAEAAELLNEILNEEKAADEKLTALAEGGINQAAGNAGGDDADDVNEASGRRAAKKTAKKSAKKTGRR